jgi:hypothetical protein
MRGTGKERRIRTKEKVSIIDALSYRSCRVSGVKGETGRTAKRCSAALRLAKRKEGAEQSKQTVSSIHQVSLSKVTILD